MYKNIRVKKRGGGTRLQRVKVLASGKYKFVKNPTRSRSNPGRGKTKRKTTKRRGFKTTRRKRRRSSRKFTIPLAPIAGLAAGVAEPIAALMEGKPEWAMNKLCQNYTGYDPGTGNFDLGNLKRGLMPLVIGLLVHKFVGGPPLNLNRTLGRANVPFVRV